jgi:sirohydrochlorin ferrochelatase
MAHGGDPAWNASVEDALAPLRERYPVALAFGMADPMSLGAGLGELADQGVERVAIVRLFLDGRSFLHQTEYFLGLRDDPPAMFILHGAHGGGHGTGHGGGHGDPEQPAPVAHDLDLTLSLDGLMQADEVSRILAARAEAISQSPADESVLVLAHGTGDDVENARWIAAMERLTGGYHAVRVETLREDWPEPRAAAERAVRGFVAAETEAGRRVLVVPFRLSGFGPYRDVLNGLDYTASEEGILPHAAVTEWVDREYRALVNREGWTPTP